MVVGTHIHSVRAIARNPDATPYHASVGKRPFRMYLPFRVVEWAIGLPIASKEGPNSTAANLCTPL